MERRYKVEVYKVEYKCPECVSGWLECIRSETVTTEGSSSVLYEHKCNVCNNLKVLDKIYPRTEYADLEVDDSFEPLKDVTESEKESLHRLGVTTFKTKELSDEKEDPPAGKEFIKNTSEEVDKDRTIKTALERVINAYSQETVAGDTPDFIVAEFLIDSLKALGRAVTVRERWYGRDEKPVAHKPKSINK